MLDKLLSEKIITVGCEYKPIPKGGVAQVMYNYEKYVYPKFNNIINSGGGSHIYKVYKLLSSLLILIITLLYNRKIKIVHIHTASNNSFKRSSLYVRLSKLFHKKCVLHIHGGGFKEYYKTNPTWITSILNQSDAIITLSESWANYFVNIQNSPVYVVNNIVAPPQNTPKLSSSGTLKLLYLGLITQQKGIYDLIEVFHKNENEFRNKVELHIGGNGEVDKMLGLVNQYGLNDMVFFEGWLSGNKKANMLSMTDIFILPSYTEGLPVSILEAMAYGKPIISTPVGGIPEIVQTGYNGILVEPGNLIELKNAIELMYNKGYRNKMGCKSYNYAQQFLPKNVMLQLNKIYNELLSK